MKFYKLFILVLTVAAALLFAGGCTTDTPAETGSGEYCKLVMSVTLPSSVTETPATALNTRAGFDNFDNEDDKWGVQGENIEELRIIILDSNGNVEHNNRYDLSNATSAGEYEYLVRNNDRKTVILLANEGHYLLDEEGMEIVGGTHSLTRYLDTFVTNQYMNLNDLKKLTVALKQNSPDDKGLSLKTPLLISAIYDNEYINAGDTGGVVSRSYLMHRAAVKYSFRIINNSDFDHTLEGIGINRIADREFLFPNATYTTNSLGHQVIEDYTTPATAKEQSYTTDVLALSLPKHMTDAVSAAEPFYVPEGLKADEAQQVTITLDGQVLDMWRDLEWLMPGEESPVKRPMVDLPRNTHVVVNITINDDNTLSFVADVQPYAEVILRPPYGLDRDPDGNIITKRNEDGTYEVLIDGETVVKDADGDIVKKKFADGSLYCIEEVYKDYIHDDSEVDYIYHFEKQYSGGNMIIIREKSLGGQFHGIALPEGTDHEHGYNDKAVFVLNKAGDFEYVTYEKSIDTSTQEEKWTIKSSTRTDMHGDTIVQANGFQFRMLPTEDMNETDKEAIEFMQKYMGTYVVKRNSDNQEELRWYADGKPCSWETGEKLSTRASADVASYPKTKAILSRMKYFNKRMLFDRKGKRMRR